MDCFNGATARTRWRVGYDGGERETRKRLQRGHRANAVERPPAPRPPPPAPERFNGATARTRWRVDGAVGDGCAGEQLQRGHRANAVERLTVPLTGSSAGRLQRGHRANAVESRRVPSPIDPVLLLQRGHRANAVERDGVRIGVNRVQSLQRGHRANAVERHRYCGGRWEEIPASTGPPRERGGEPPRPIRRSRCSALQRGHRANAVERSPARRARCGSVVGFNGATARTRWRGARADRAATAADVASTGPPRERGGEESCAGSPRGPRPGFNGATARTRWRGTRSPASRAASHRFNGATARTRWRARVIDLRGLVAGGASTGPPRERGGEAPTARHSECYALYRASTGPPRERGGEQRGAPPTHLTSRRFNGATARTRWRGHVESVRARVAGVASTGPPRERGGEAAAKVGEPFRLLASTGPPRERGGESSRFASRPDTRPSFNGATARTRWRVSAREVEAAQQRWLQRGHRANAVESGAEPFQGTTRGPLQRGHRANAVESGDVGRLARVNVDVASTGPPRERGGEPPRRSRLRTGVCGANCERLHRGG